MHPIYFSVRFLFWSEKNETALSRVELRWYQLSLLIKSQVHLAQRGRENWLQTRFIMAAKDGGTVCSLPTSILFEISSKDMQGYSGGVEIQFLEWEATSISSYEILDLSHCLLLWQEYKKKLNLVRTKSLGAVDYPVLWICQSCLQGLISTVTQSLWGRTEFEGSWAFYKRLFSRYAWIHMHTLGFHSLAKNQLCQ